MLLLLLAPGVCSTAARPLAGAAPAATGTAGTSGSGIATDSAPAPSAAFETLLFMDLNDTVDSWGLLWASANTVVPNATFRPPPLAFDAGSTVLSVMPSAQDPSLFEVYAENTTGWEPLRPQESGHVGGAGRARGQHDCTLLRYTTRDFQQYSVPHVALQLSPCSGTPTMKSIARDDAGELYVMFAVGVDHDDGYSMGTFVSRDAGMSWAMTNTTGVAAPARRPRPLISRLCAGR